MSFGSDGTRPLGANVLDAMHQSRQHQAMRVIADNRRLLATGGDAEPLDVKPASSRLDRRRADAAVAPAGSKGFGRLLATLALVLIALHGICAAMIIDHALAAHAPSSVTISHED
jgi:hypothetical protein